MDGQHNDKKGTRGQTKHYTEKNTDLATRTALKTGVNASALDG